LDKDIAIFQREQFAGDRGIEGPEPKQTQKRDQGGPQELREARLEGMVQDGKFRDFAFKIKVEGEDKGER
jgi:hypothetical protein